MKKGARPGALGAKLGKPVDNELVKKGEKFLNAPGVVLHAIQAADKLIHNPAEIGRAIKAAQDNPLGAIKDVASQVGDVKDTVETVKTVAEVAIDGTQKTLANVKEHGLVKGLTQTAHDAKAGLKREIKDIGSNFSHETGGGLTNVPKAVAKAVEERTAKAAARGMLKEFQAIPELAPKGFFAKVGGWLGKVSAPFEKLAEKAGMLGNRGADKLALWMEKGSVGRKILSGLDKLNPAGGLAKTVLAEARAVGEAKGLVKASETVAKVLEKTGATVVKSEAGAIARVITKTGVEIAPKVIEAATKVGLETAAREGGTIAAKTAGKGLGRFAPGVNIAIAAYDTVHAAQVWRDPNSTGWQKGMASVTAVGSILAATNIPIVSQIGAAVSIVTSVLENVKPESIVHAAKAVGGAIADGARAVGRFFSGW